MSTSKFIVDLNTYDDTGSTNDPFQSIFRWRKELNLTGVVDATAQNASLPPGENVILLPGPCRWIYVETDQEVYIKFNGEIDENCVVSPSAAGTKDGMLLKRGSFSALTISVPGTDTASVTVFTAY